MKSLSIALLAILPLSSIESSAAVLHFDSLAPGEYHGTMLSVPGATVISGGDGLFVGDTVPNSICALDVTKFSCANDLLLGFDRPVTDVSFTAGNQHYDDNVTLYGYLAGALVGSLNFATAGLIDLSSFGTLDTLFFDDHSDTGNGMYYADITYAEIAPVPLPGALPALMIGLGALGVLRRRKAPPAI
jgi:hypothetical protein